MKKNIVVIGDLVIDHTIFVRDKHLRPHSQIDPQEQIFEVIKEQYTAGGAANTARILSIINEGKTYLWGITGKAPWNNYRTILETSSYYDNSERVIELYGIQDETDTPMHTIHRIISTKDNSIRNYIRFDELSDIQITNGKHYSIISTLNNLHEKYKIDAIIINELDIFCISKEIAEKIAKFSTKNNIPLIIDPKRNRKKYDEIKATVIMPNFNEWLHLINEPDKETYWRERLDNEDSLIEIAQRSLFYLRNFQYQIIKCDKDGVIAILPLDEDENTYGVYRMAAYNSSISHNQFGCGDVMAGIIALKIERNHSSKLILEAIHYSKIVNAAYREQLWAKMPSLKDIKEKEQVNDLNQIKWYQNPITRVSKNILHLPKSCDLNLSKFETVIPNIYSGSDGFKSSIDELLNEIYGNNGVPLKSIILDGPAGCGKTQIMNYILSKNNQQANIFSVDFTNELINCNLSNLDDYFKNLRKKYDLDSETILLLIVDEVLKLGIQKGKSFFERNGVILLNSAHMNNIRFLFIDATFNKKLNSISNEIKTRCPIQISIPSLKERPEDIPILFGNFVKNYCVQQNIVDINIEASVFLSIMNQSMIRELSPREMKHIAEDGASQAIIPGVNKMVFKYEYLPNDYRLQDQKFTLDILYNIK